jgi:hypothetical protein
MFSREDVQLMQMTPGPGNTSNVDSLQTVALNLILAIGSQCRASNASDQRYASTKFARARKACLVEGLENPSIDLIRCFLLMTFYMLGACQRNAAFMYLGIASQASFALGLHVMEQYQQFGAEERAKR